QPHAMRPVDRIHRLECPAPTNVKPKRGPPARAVHGQHDSLLKWRGKESRGRMTLVVLGEQELVIDPAASREDSKRLFQVRLLKKFLFYPKWNRHSERLETTWCVIQIGLQQPFEF